MRSDHGPLALAAHDSARGAPYSYDEFERRAERARAAARRRERLVGGGAAAAVVLALSGGLLFVATRTSPPEAVVPVAAAPAAREISAEHWLAVMPAEPVVVRVGSYAAVAALEDRIAFIDDRMNDSRVSGDVAVDPAALDRERTRLINALASVRYAQTLAGNFQ